MPRHHTRRFGYAVSAALAAILVSCAAPESEPGAPDTDAALALPVGPAAGDMDLSPFYRWAEPMPEQAGAVLRSEPYPLGKEFVAAKSALRILYASTDARWGTGAIPVSGLLYLPSGDPPAGGWPLLSWGHGTMGIADRCAPSWTNVRERDATYLNQWLAAGFAVVASDYQGLGGPGPHPYLDWRTEGTSVLDAARAAIAAGQDQIANQVFVAGQSQGSGAALGAAMLAKDYTPDLNVRGAIITGFNRTFPEGPIQLPPRNSSNLFLSYATGGLRDDAPTIDSIVSESGASVLAVTRQGCSSEIGSEARRLGIADMAQAFSIPMDQLAAISLPVTDMPMKATGIPLFFGTGLADATTTPTLQHAGITAMCAAGNTVAWRRYDGLGHDGALLGSLDDSVAFARALLEGSAARSDCGDLSQPGPLHELNPNAPFNDD